jgi:hypothetical protein
VFASEAGEGELFSTAQAGVLGEGEPEIDRVIGIVKIAEIAKIAVIGNPKL